MRKISNVAFLLAALLTQATSISLASDMAVIRAMDSGFELTKDGRLLGWLDDKHLVFTSRPHERLRPGIRSETDSTITHTFILNTGTKQVEKVYDDINVECISENGSAIWQKDGNLFRGDLGELSKAEQINLNNSTNLDERTILLKVPFCIVVRVHELLQFGPLPKSSESRSSRRYKLFDDDGIVVVEQKNDGNSPVLVSSFDSSGANKAQRKIHTRLAPSPQPRYVPFNRSYFIQTGGYSEESPNARPQSDAYLIGLLRRPDGTFGEVTIPLLSKSIGVPKTYRSSSINPVLTPYGIEISANGSEWLVSPEGRISEIMSALVFAKAPSPSGLTIAVLSVRHLHDSSNPKLTFIQVRNQ